MRSKNHGPDAGAVSPAFVRVLTAQAAIAFLRHRWADLYRQDLAATPYQSPAWLTAWAARIHAPDTPMILVVPGPAGPVAALPLVRRLTPGGRWEIVPVGAPYAEHVRVVGPGAEQPSTTAALAAKLDALASAGDRVMLCDVPITSALGRHMMTDPRWPQTAVPCAQVPLPVAWAAMSQSTRKSHRRRARALDVLVEQGHQITYRRSQTPLELADGYTALRGLHRRQWSANVRPESDLERDGAAWQAVIDECGPRLAFVAAMELDGEVVAAQLCLYRGQHCYSLRPAMHPDHAAMAPGHALLRMLVADLADAGFTCLDLGRTVDTPGQAGYKAQYLAGRGWTYTITATHTVRGR